MNILLVNHYAGSIHHGMEYRPYYVAREWVRLGHHVTIATASWSHLRQRNPDCRSEVTEDWIDGIRYVWLPTPTYDGNGIRRVINIFSFIGQLIRHHSRVIGDYHPHAVIASSTYPLDIYPTSRIARRYRAKLVFEVHDLWPLTPIELGGMSRWHPFIVALQTAENFAYRHADRVVSMLPKADSHMREHGMQPEKFVHIPNGVDVPEWDREVEDLPGDHAQAIQDARNAGRFLVGYAGGHGLAYDLSTLLESAAHLKSSAVTFFLVGDGPDKEKLRETARNRGLDNVQFLPSISKKAVPTFLRLMDVLYIGWPHHPLYRFGVSPNKLFDYMMASRPVIHAIDTQADPVAESGCGISCPPEKPTAVSKAILELIARPAHERELMGRQGRGYVLRHHDYQGLAHKFLEVLH